MPVGFKHWLQPGKVDIGWEGNQKLVRVYVTVKWDGKRLSITGVEGPWANGNCAGGWGQCHPVKLTSVAKGWTWLSVDRLNEVWDKWHLNDLRAACEHQRALGWTWNSHPSEPCPECGHKLGSKWLLEEVPADVIEWLRGLPTVDAPKGWK